MPQNLVLPAETVFEEVIQLKGGRWGEPVPLRMEPHRRGDQDTAQTEGRPCEDVGRWRHQREPAPRRFDLGLLATETVRK